MDWNGNLRIPNYNISRLAAAAPPPNDNSFNYLYSYNYHHDQFPAAHSGLEMKQPLMHEMQMDKNINATNYGQLQDPKKKRLSNEQLESLENSFQEEIKLDPDRKMKLAKDLGLQPRQIAVWFQNRRARWKGKQLERLYNSLKQDFDNVSREKHKLQQEVLALRAVLKDQLTKQQVSTGYTEVSGEETVESTSIPCSDAPHGTNNTVHQIADCNYGLNIDGYNPGMMPAAYWASLP